MTIFELTTAHRLPRPRAEVFPYFGDAANLEAITPPWLSFRILTPLPLDMRKGTLLNYSLRLHGLPIRWRTEITAWEPPHRFVDEERRGPYRLWVHEHTFEEIPGGTLATDRVRYAVVLGRLTNRLLVARDLRKIFDYRNRKILEVFGSLPGGDEPVRIRAVEG